MRNVTSRGLAVYDVLAAEDPSRTDEANQAIADAVKSLTDNMLVTLMTYGSNGMKTRYHIE